jgi:serine/threonine-protein kinase HipA
MNTSKKNREAFVWIWLPGETQPVVAGKLEEEGGFIHFNYGKSYLERVGGIRPAIPIYEPELPLQPGVLPLPDGLQLPNSIRDCAPDAWGRRVIINKTLGQRGRAADTADLSEMTYLLE